MTDAGACVAGELVRDGQRAVCVRQHWRRDALEGGPGRRVAAAVQLVTCWLCCVALLVAASNRLGTWHVCGCAVTTKRTTACKGKGHSLLKLLGRRRA